MDRSFLVLFLLWPTMVTAALTPQERYWRTLLPNILMPHSLQGMLRVTDGKTNFTLGSSGADIDIPRPPSRVRQSCITLTYSFCYNASAPPGINKDKGPTPFFLAKDLYPGAKMHVNFSEDAPPAPKAFLPRAEADTIPFSSSKLPEILRQFSVRANSVEAEAILGVLLSCESQGGAAEEKKYCATSLESMVDFTLSSLGTHRVQAMSTEVISKDGKPHQLYTVVPSGVQELAGDSAVACHPVPYPYLVFYCHVTRATRAYKVALVGEDGSRVNAVAVCHTDTSAWNPQHISFQVLKVKPGTVPVCHFFPLTHVVWTPLLATSG